MASSPLVWCIFVVVLSMPSAIRAYATEMKCPVLDDDTWKERNSQCEEGTKYHCQDNEEGRTEAHGCFQEKVCKKGAHPVIENGKVICLDCPQGSYQPQNELFSSQYTYSMCFPHGTCMPKEKTLCKAGTQDQDTRCRCSESYKPSSQDCGCFTNDDACYCTLIGCPNGTSINEDGSCISPTTPIPSSSTNEAPSEPAPIPVRTVVISVIAGIVIVFLAILVIWCWCHRRHGCLKSNPEGQTDSRPCNGGPVTTESIAHKPPITVNIHKVKNLHISTRPEENGHCVNLSHGGESNGTINQMNTGEEVSPDIESYSNSLLHYGGESNGSINQMNTSEEDILDMQGHQIPLPIQVTSDIDSLTETDAVPTDGQSVSCGSQEIGISGRPLHEDETVRKMLCDRTQKSQETHESEELSETDKLLHSNERVLG